jgi:hypothetical protein
LNETDPDSFPGKRDLRGEVVLVTVVFGWTVVFIGFRQQVNSGVSFLLILCLSSFSKKRILVVFANYCGI